MTGKEALDEGKKKDEGGNPPGEDGADGKKPAEGGDGGEPQFSDEQKAYVQKLRSESASYRTKAKDLESKVTSLSEKFSKMEKGIKTAVGLEDQDDLNPDQLKQSLSDRDAYIVQLESQMALLNAADEHGIPAEGRKYFALLIDEAAQNLEEGEELSEEAVTEVITEVKARFGKAANTSVGGNGKEDPAPGASDGSMTVEKFARMTTTEKSVLYQKQPQLYAELFKTAKEKRLLI